MITLWFETFFGSLLGDMLLTVIFFGCLAFGAAVAFKLADKFL